MPFVLQNAGCPRHIVVVHKTEKMRPPVEAPVLRAELALQGMVDFKQVHAVETGVETLIAFVVGG